MQVPDPYREAIVSVLPATLKEELLKAEEQLKKELEAVEAAKVRAMDMIRIPGKRHFEHMEAELETEHRNLVLYHCKRLEQKLRALLQTFKDTEEEEPPF